MIPAIDIGCTNDIHPQDKKNVGKRLADTALHHVYHVPGVIPSGPVCEKAEHESGKVRISFRYGDGLQITGDVSESFYIAESNGIFYPADWYQIEGTSLLLGSSKLKAPCNVRYCWSSDPKAILFNGAGLPAAPFRTDSYALVD
jgi:sialate O-acetylesterase